jgi:bifunctional non-homologous end joining protein LigD
MYIDYVRNSQGATVIAPFSTRARAGAPVAVPLSWDEVDKKILPNHFNVKNIRSRLEHLKKDPWENYFSTRQSITKSMQKALGIL